MEAKELRIGSWVTEKGKEKIMYSVSNHNAKDYSKIEPIPITERWLFDFGFKPIKLTDDVWGFCTFSHKAQFIYINSGQVRYGCEVDGAIFLEDGLLSHVHQLQNLYFALCGEELKKK